jgi:hypothetical protein
MFMKRIFIFMSAVLFMQCAAALAKNINFEATVTRTKVAVGGQIQLNLTFNNTQNISALDLPPMEGFSHRYVGPSSSMSIVNGVVTSSITHIYLLQAIKSGKFGVGPFEFENNGDKYSSNQIAVEVLAASASAQLSQQPQAQQADLSQDISDRVFVVLEAAKKNIYVNETVPLTVKLYVNRLSIRDIQFPQIQHEGISIGQFSQPKQYQDVVAGVSYDVIEFNTTMFGLKPGELKIGPATVSCNLISQKQTRRRPSDDFFDSNIFEDFFGRYETHPLTLNSRSYPVTVLALPDEGKPAGFAGALGSFSFDVSISPCVVKVGDPITIKAVVKGQGNFSTVDIAKKESTGELKAYEPQIKQQESVKTFEQVVMPMNPEVKEIPAVSFSFFNTEKGVYETITRGPFPITVSKPDKEEQTHIIEGKQIQAQQVPREEKLGRDIIFIKESEGSLSRKGSFLFRDTVFILFQCIALLGYLFVLTFHLWSKRLHADIRYARKLQAPGKARIGIAAARKLLKANKRQEFYDVLFDTLQAYLGDRFHLASRSITAGVIDEVLKPRKVSEDIQEKVNRIFKDCDMARYAPGGFAADQMQQALSDLESVIDYLQRNRV